MAKYDRGLQQFHEWLQLHGLQYTTIPELDEHLADYVNFMWCEDPGPGSFQRAGHPVYGLPFRIPRARHNLPAAHLSLRGWRRVLEQRSPPPITKQVATAIAVDLWQHQCYDAAVLVLLSHECYLRAGEGLRLLVGDFADAALDSRGLAGLHTECGVGGIRLSTTKTGPNQFVTIRDRLVLTLLSRHCAGRPKTDPAFSLSYDQYRRQFADSVQRLGLGTAGFVLHSLRHGGATSDFCDGRPYDYIQHRGRWQQSASMIRYIQAGAALSLQLHYSGETTAFIQAAQTHTHAWFGLAVDPRQIHSPNVG